jgi:hypothetical protein
MRHQPTHPFIDTLVQQPELFTTENINTLLGINSQNPTDHPYQAKELINTRDLREAVLRIFDQNKDFSFDNSYTGYLGWLNDRSQSSRKKKFIRKLKANPKAVRVVAEGDSWFEHPVSKEVIDWINILGDKDIAIFSIARGGDFLTNILEEREYITEVSVINPEFFLLSAGGIELVSGWRVSLMADPRQHYVTDEYLKKHPLLGDVLADPGLPDETRKKLIRGSRFLTREFFALIALLELKYKYMIKQLRKKFPELKMICHGYDYPIPSFDRGPWTKPIQRLMRIIGDNGRHFKQPLLIKGIDRQEDQSDIAFTMLHLFNEMLLRLVHDPIFGHRVYMIDCRGYARKEDWADELHLLPAKIEQVAAVFIHCMRQSDGQQKVFYVKRNA